MGEESPGSDDEQLPYMIEIDGREVPLSRRAMVEQQLFTAKTAYENTGNPLFVWHAISFFIGAANELLTDEVTPEWEPWTGILPKWCLDYLAKCASAVINMDWGCDSPPSECAAMIPALFGFTKKGWNAFNERRELRGSQHVERYYYELRDEGISVQQAMNETLERYGLENERSVRRKIAAVAKAYTPRSNNPKGEDETTTER
jgi:hypothetical protein